MIKTKKQAMECRGVNGPFQIQKYITLHLKRGDGKFIKTNFWLCPKLQKPMLIGRPTLRELGYKFELDFEFIHEAQLNQQIVDPDSTYYDKIDYFDKDYYQIYFQDTVKKEILKEKLTRINSPKIKKLIQHFWTHAQESIAKNAYDVGLIDTEPFRIDLKEDAEPIYIKARPQQEVKNKAMAKMIEEMLKADIIAECRGPWGAPAFLVPKPTKNGKKVWRLVVDYRELNKRTILDAYPFPDIHETLLQIRNKKFISLIDIRAGFYHLPVDIQDQYKTAFTTLGGTYCWKRVPMGLKNSPMAFQRCITHLFKDIPNVTIYMDDIIIHSETEEQHLLDLKKVFKIITESHLKVRWDKCQFLIDEAKYLGYKISKHGLQADKGAINKVLRFPIPKNRKQVERYLGSVTWLSDFIPCLADLIYPISELRKEKYEFRWTEYQQEAFDLIKKHVAETPILIYPDFAKPFIIVVMQVLKQLLQFSCKNMKME